jgi:transcriptional regulator with XRE-family HTH domain
MANREKPHSAVDELEAYRLLVAEESLILDTQIAIQTILNEREMTQADLARKMGVGESYISQMLGASARNLTLRTVARVMSALGEIPHVTIRRRLTESPEYHHPYQSDADFGPWEEVVMLDAAKARSGFGWSAQEWAANENHLIDLASRDLAAA